MFVELLLPVELLVIFAACSIEEADELTEAVAVELEESVVVERDCLLAGTWSGLAALSLALIERCLKKEA